VGENKRVRGPVSECEREQEKGKRTVKTVRKRERESCHGAQEPLLWGGEKDRKTEKELQRERELGKVRSKQQSTQETGEDREYDVTRAAHISTQWHAVTARLSLPVQIQHHHSCSSVGKQNTFWVRDNCRGNVTVMSHISKWTVEGTLFNYIFINHKALAHDSAVTHLKVFHWIDTECRKPQMGTQCQ